MAAVIIKIAPNNVSRDAYFCDNLASLVQPNLNNYTSVGPIELVGEKITDLAEEAFDLTNNPSRQREREKLYGNGPSLSVGDIVEVDGVSLVCKSVGWELLN